MASASGSLAQRDQRRDSDHVSFLAHKHFRWLWISVALCLAVVAGYIFAPVEPRPNGGTWYGYTLGTIGVLLIVWLSLLGVRKRAITEGRWSLKAWTSAHVYLGLSLVVIGTLHTGFQFGWNVHTLAYVLMMLVILSGLYGITVYALLPRALSSNRGEVTQKQMIEGLAAIDRQLDQAAQPLARSEADKVIAALEQDPFGFGLIARLTNTYPGDRTRSALSALERGGGSEAEQKVIALLGKRGDQLALMRRQMRIKAMLEVWLYIHVPATLALLAALTAHIVSVFFYW